MASEAIVTRQSGETGIGVLILVLVEDGFRVEDEDEIEITEEVLILVLVEDGFRETLDDARNGIT